MSRHDIITEKERLMAMDAIIRIRRAFHDFIDGRITRAEMEKRLRELQERDKAQESLPFKEKEAA